MHRPARIGSMLCVLLFTAGGLGCGSNVDDVNSGPVCETLPSAEEMEMCVAEFDTTILTAEQMQRFCDNTCDTLASLAITARELHTLGPLEHVREVQGSLRLEQMQGLERFDGLENLEAVGTEFGGVFQVRDLLSLQTTVGFDSLELVNADEFRIAANRKLTTIEGFSSLTRIEGGPLIITQNNKLESIDGFENLEYVEGVRIDRNPELSRCEAQAFVEGIDEIDGDVVIENNAPCE